MEPQMECYYDKKQCNKKCKCFSIVTVILAIAFFTVIGLIIGAVVSATILGALAAVIVLAVVLGLFLILSIILNICICRKNKEKKNYY